MEMILYDGCGSFSHINERDSFHLKEITVNVKYEDGKGDCIQEVITIPTTYTFSTSSKGTYIFKFATYNNKFKVDSLIVE